MTSFEVETSSLNSTVKNMESELSRITEISKRLYAALSALDGMWIGTAKDAFAAQYRADQEMLNKMSQTIDAVIEGMDSARKTYEQCEQSVKSEIQKVAI